MPDTNLGLLGGLAQGIKEGLSSYQDARKMRLSEDEMKRKSKIEQGTYQMGLQEKGYQEDPESGGLIATPEHQKEIDYKRSSYDPNSGVSSTSRESTQGLLNEISPGLGEKFIKPDMTAADIERQSKEGLIGKYISGIYGMRGKEITNQRTSERNSILREGLNLRGKKFNAALDTEANKVADKFDEDSIIKDLTEGKQGINIARPLLEKPMTPEIWADLQTKIATLLSAGSSKASSQEQKKEIDTYDSKWQKFKQKITNRPQFLNSDEFKPFIGGLLDELENSYNKNISLRANQINTGRSYSVNSAAQKMLENKYNQYNQKEEPAGLIPQEDTDAVKWAKKNPNDPRSKEILQVHGI